VKNPAGVECRYFYGDYYRGREREVCRLLDDAWSRDLCRSCPVPGIVRANGCPKMVLRGSVGRRLILGKQVRVRAFCRDDGRVVKEPKVGCGRCHER
jgi:hypothetical protein